MTTMLNLGIEKILRVFYEDKHKKIHLRELSRQTGLEGQTIMRHLKKLEQNKILKSERVGNLKQFYLFKSKQTNAIMTLFDTEKLNDLPLLRQNAIATFIENIQPMPIFIIVFGSTAKGTFKERSDIDLLLVTNSKINTKLAEREVEAITSMKLSVFQISIKDFKKELKIKEDSVLQSAIQTGFPALNHMFYYEVLNNDRV